MPDVTETLVITARPEFVEHVADGGAIGTERRRAERRAAPASLELEYIAEQIAVYFATDWCCGGKHEEAERTLRFIYERLTGKRVEGDPI